MHRSISRAVPALITFILAATPAWSGVPFPPNCVCVADIAQNPTRTACINNFEPDVVRLCPSGDFDEVYFGVQVRDANGVALVGVLITAVERSGIVNITNDGAPSVITDSEGQASLYFNKASGYGLVGICADGVLLCDVEVRSPDVNNGATPALCGLGTSASAVAGSDIANPSCGFLVKFGTVTPGINDAWDLNCTNTVNGFDVNGAGSINAHFGDGGTLGVKNTCP